MTRITLKALLNTLNPDTRITIFDEKGMRISDVVKDLLYLGTIPFEDRVVNRIFVHDSECDALLLPLDPMYFGGDTQ